MAGEPDAPICLTIAGIDSSGGAGVSIDTGAFRLAGCHPAVAVTALTAQNSRGVHSIHTVPAAEIAAQVEAVFSDMDVAAVKTGMIPDAASMYAVAEQIRKRSVPLVVDPVMIATSGSALTTENTVAPMVESLFPLASLVTPNMPEAAAISGRESTPDTAARDLADRIGTAVLLKGGHGRGEEVIDLLVWEDGLIRWTSPRLPGSFHGTGCFLSASIAAQLAYGLPLPEAVDIARSLLRRAMEEAWRPGETSLFYLRVPPVVPSS